MPPKYIRWRDYCEQPRPFFPRPHVNGGVLGVIPARLESSRLPRKPLYALVGRPLIEWVWSRVVGTGVFDEVVVATDSEEVARTARAFGARVELTSVEHPSGTDRVAEVARSAAYRQFDTVVNVQGDEPFVSAGHLCPVIDLVRGGAWGIGTVATPLLDAVEFRDPAVVKVVRAEDGGALYFSRSPIPHPRDGEIAAEDLSGGAYLRHIGIYSYTRQALLDWVGRPPGQLEQIEKLEQLRPLAAGSRIGVALVDPVERGVDTPADAARAERRLRAELLEAS
jgi:3-deoxy-manno-octulosonate cytidylyltransferase (CMP-KDO synthetase)